MKACRSLLSSVYLAPEQIRTCCKRFHVDDKLKGDAVLFESDSVSNISNVSLDDVMAKKLQIIEEINSDSFCSSHQCHGCPS